MDNIMKLKTFSEIDIDDIFFNSLKEDYEEFPAWFERKKNEKAYVFEDGGRIQGFLYLKKENGPILDINPPIHADSVLKIGTMKINPHGTRLGERFIKKSLDYAIEYDIEKLYVTVFSKHTALLDLFCKYGFKEHGRKESSNGEELVLVKSLESNNNDLLLNYPRLTSKNRDKYLLAIYPDYHTKLFPDSILNNETFDIIEDVSHTNSIHKIYICKMNVSRLKKGDILVIYRTTDHQGPAEYRSVVSSICVIEEIKSKRDFPTFDTFLDYCINYSIFTEPELLSWYNENIYYVIKMTYNVALKKRLTRGKLISEAGVDRKAYWGFMKLSDSQFNLICKKGGISEGIIID